jgi:hypothetical protein
MKPTTLMVSVVLTVSRWQAPVHSLEATGALSLYLASQREQTAMTLSPLPRWEALRVGSRSSASSASGAPGAGQEGGWQASATEHLRLVSALCPALRLDR